jgi:hypothetical protein
VLAGVTSSGSDPEQAAVKPSPTTSAVARRRESGIRQSF